MNNEPSDLEPSDGEEDMSAVDADLEPNGDLGPNGNWDHEEVCQHARRAIEAADRYDAKAAGLTIEQWLSLSEHERIKIKEDTYDAMLARENYRTTLADYRGQLRLWIEAGEMQEPYTGRPQWLRDAYAQERPIEIAVEYFSLFEALETTTGDAQKEVIKQIAERTWRGWVIERTAAEARTLLLEEVDRTGLREIFNEARDQSELRRILNS